MNLWKLKFFLTNRKTKERRLNTYVVVAQNAHHAGASIRQIYGFVEYEINEIQAMLMKTPACLVESCGMSEAWTKKIAKREGNG